MRLCIQKLCKFHYNLCLSQPHKKNNYLEADLKHGTTKQFIVVQLVKSHQILHEELSREIYSKTADCDTDTLIKISCRF